MEPFEHYTNTVKFNFPILRAALLSDLTKLSRIFLNSPTDVDEIFI